MAALPLLFLLLTRTPFPSSAAAGATTPSPASAPASTPEAPESTPPPASTAEAPESTPPPTSTPKAKPKPIPSDLPSIMSKKGCKSFAGLLSNHPSTLGIFEDVIMGGLTVFCPSNRAVAAFMPHYKNLTAGGKSSLLLYHGFPVYNSLSTLKSSNGVMNTLATDGVAKNFNVTIQDDGDDISLKTGVATATITGTAFDDHQYLAIFTISDVLQPPELFKVDEPPSPAPEPSHAKKNHHGKDEAEADAPADSPDSASADEAADESSSMQSVTVLRCWMAVVTVVVGLIMA